MRRITVFQKIYKIYSRREQSSLEGEIPTVVNYG